MDLTMSIANLSTQLSSAKLSQNVDCAMAKKTMEVQETAMDNLLKIMPEVPSLGQHIDTKA